MLSRPGLDQKTRSLLTLGILGGLGRFQELGIYTNAALASGATVDEIKEALSDHVVREERIVGLFV